MLFNLLVMIDHRMFCTSLNHIASKMKRRIYFLGFHVFSHVEEEEELREVPPHCSQADDDPEVTQFYVNPIAKPIPQGRAQTSLQDTISDLNMHKAARNGLEVSSPAFTFPHRPVGGRGLSSAEKECRRRVLTGPACVI